MKNFYAILILLITIFTTSMVLAQEMNTNINIIPKPKSIVINEGSFKLNSITKLYYKNDAKQIAEYLNEIIKPSTGFDLVLGEWDGGIYENSIILSLSNKDKVFGKEGYTLVVNKTNVLIEASELNGLFYGVQTLRQLLPVEIESKIRVVSPFGQQARLS